MLRENKHFQHLAFYDIRKNKPFFSVPTGYAAFWVPRGNGAFIEDSL